jgi:FkbM family methyltransferase
MRKLGYMGRIVSFEPIEYSFSQLQKTAQSDPLWDVYNYALGNKNMDSSINISENFDSSSILKINDIHKDARRSSNVNASQVIKVKKLDSIYTEIARNEKNIYIKMDTQGYEKFVIEGASSVLCEALGLQIELSLIPLYEESETYDTIISLLERFGFRLYSIEPGFYNKQTGRLLQFDGIFFKES